MATVSFETIGELAGKLALARIACAPEEAISLAEAGALIAASGARWATVDEACTYWRQALNRPMPASLVAADCPDLPEDVSAVISNYPKTQNHQLSLVRHGGIARYHWPHDSDSRLFLVSLA